MAKKNKDKVMDVRVGMKIMTIVFLETGQTEVSGPLGNPDMCRLMLDGARKVVEQAAALQRPKSPLEEPLLESPAQKAARLRVAGAHA